MSTAMTAGASTWSWSQFWLASPVILVIFIFGIVALTAIARARAEDVPKVLAIVASALARLTWRSADQWRQADPDDAGGEVARDREPGHDESDHREVGDNS